MEINMDMQYVLETAETLLAVDSPSGFTKNVVMKLKSLADALGVENQISNRGNFIVSMAGTSQVTVGLAAHVDTLGLMVRSIKADGTLAIVPVGSPILPTLDGEYCKIYTRDNRVYTGTILSNSPSRHVYMDADTLERTEENLHIRIDEKTRTKEDTENLGIMAGDYVCYDTKFTVSPAGFIKSRFLDDKLSAAILMGVIKYLKDNNLKPRHNVQFLFSTNEEVGNGLSYIPADISELVAVDMGCIGKDLSCTEYDVSICAKDTGGPYDYELTTKLITLAKENGLNFAVDIYPRYSSDVTAAFTGGNNIRGALIGPGVAASHGMERSHIDGVYNTFQLVLLYLMADE